MYLKLNAGGRKDLFDPEEIAFKGDWIDVMTKTRENLDCLFYYLSANPSLCKLDDHYSSVVVGDNPKADDLVHGDDEITEGNCYSIQVDDHCPLKRAFAEESSDRISDQNSTEKVPLPSFDTPRSSGQPERSPGETIVSSDGLFVNDWTPAAKRIRQVTN
jgi:hypothetical protein